MPAEKQEEEANHSEHKQLQLVEFFTPAVTSDRLSNNHHAQVSVSFKHAHTLTHTHSLSLSHTNTHTLSLSHTHTHTPVSYTHLTLPTMSPV